MDLGTETSYQVAWLYWNLRAKVAPKGRQNWYLQSDRSVVRRTISARSGALKGNSMDTVRPTYASPLLRVLLIEDSPNDAQLVGLELLNQGYDATVTRVEVELELGQLGAGEPDRASARVRGDLDRLHVVAGERHGPRLAPEAEPTG